MKLPTAERVLVVGVDCAAPRFVFGEDAFDLPNLRKLIAQGVWGRLESSHPPITVPAWACMTTGKDAGTLGCYGFRNRTDYSYAPLATANASAIREPRVWDVLSRHGRKSVVLGVPQTYPPKPLNGWLVPGFLAPDTQGHYTYPKSLKGELEEAVGEYLLDVNGFRTPDKGPLLERVFQLMRNRFETARYLMESKPWDFFMMVEMGMDRLHHGFWRYCDPEHPRFEPDNPFRDAFRDYYQAVDNEIGRLAALAGDDTAVLVVSDHGAKAMHGGICINQWLLNEGLLALKEPVSSPTRLEDCAIDWARTKAWSTGGYYARVFINVEGREPEGTVPAGEYEGFRAWLAGAIEAIPGPDGRGIGTKALKPQDLYEEVNGIPPDLLVYFGDLDWRSAGLVGVDGIYTFENDTGPDDANHDYYGILIAGRPLGGCAGEVEGARVVDIAPTVLGLLGVEAPAGLQGKVISERE